ncbi:MAG: ShlB/FhaC/HecB family hemolysin secretion/activation protein [Verrucomicrobiota bacterium]|nr:ShlB/FhaC/HecB family hemolysin secretion/activation protein [Verrucomicrobiota bacterium]
MKSAPLITPLSFTCARLAVMVAFLATLALAPHTARAEDKKSPSGDLLIKTAPIKSIIFYPDNQSASAANVAGTKGILFRNVDKLAGDKKFKKAISIFLGKSIDEDEMQRVTEVIVEYLRAKGMPMVYVNIPEQNLKSGHLKIVVTQAKAEYVGVTGNKFFSKEFLASQTTVQKGDTIDGYQLLRDVNWLNKISPNYLRSKSSVSTGKEYGSGVVEYEVQDAKPYTFSVGYDDSGNAITGDDRLTFGGVWGNAWGVGHTLAYSHVTDLDFEFLSAHNASYRAPLPWRHILTVFGSFADVTADIPDVTFKGESWQVGLDYEIPLAQAGLYEHGINAGFDFKSSNNNLSFGGTSVFANDVDIVQWSLGYHGYMPDAFGWSSFNIKGVYSPGGLTDNNTDQDFNIGRALSKADYEYARLDLSRMLALPYGLELSGKAAFQLSSGNLQASEGFGLGGYSTIRGYEETEFNADHGVMTSWELSSPRVSLLGLVNENWKQLDQTLKFLAFVDYGHGWLGDALPGQDDDVEMLSVGPGLRYAVGPWASLRVDYGFQLVDTGLNSRFNDRWHVGVTLQY